MTRILVYEGDWQVIPPPVSKHAMHDQKTHGSWATGNVGNFTLDASSDPMGLTTYNHPNGSRVIFQGVDNYYDDDGNRTPDKKERITEALEIVDSLQKKYPIPDLTLVFENDPDGENAVLYPILGQTVNMQRTNATTSYVPLPPELRSKHLPESKGGAPYIVITSAVLGRDSTGAPHTYKTYTEANFKSYPENHLISGKTNLLKSVLTHEYGHALDNRSESDAMWDWSNMDDSSTSTYGLSNKREHFAETFTAWMLDRSNPKWQKSIVGLGMDKLGTKVNKAVASGFIVKDRFDGGEPFLQEFGEVLKHEGGGHDQSSHGNWADGSHDASVISTDTQIAFHDGAIKATDNILSPSAYKSQLTGNLNRTYPKTYLDEATKNPAYQEALQTHLKRVGFPETVRVFSSSAQEGEYLHGSVAPLWDSGAVGYESKESPKEFSVSRSDIIGIGKVADSGIWFRNAKAVKKHQEHDQKTHGNWALSENSPDLLTLGTFDEEFEYDPALMIYSERYGVDKEGNIVGVEKYEHNAIDYYSQEGYKYLNPLLRNPSNKASDTDKYFQQHIDGLDSLIENSPDMFGDKTLFRVVDNFVLAAMTIGDSFIDKGFTSTTRIDITRNTDARDALGEIYDTPDTVAVILPSSSKSGKGFAVDIYRTSVNDTSSVSDREKEVLLPRNTVLKFLGYRKGVGSEDKVAVFQRMDK